MEGPRGTLNYLGQGNFAIKEKPARRTKIGLIAGGTGITPIYQLAQASSLAQEGVDFVLLYSNKTKHDILVEDDLSGFQKINPDHLKVFHTLTRHNTEAHGEWRGLSGRISADILKECKFPEPGSDTLIAYCGPRAFNAAVEESLKSLGYTAEMMHKF